jgi:magnesium transporter
MFQFKEYQAKDFDESLVKQVSGDKDTILYFYNPDKSFFNRLEEIYQQDFYSWFYEEREAMYQLGSEINDGEYLNILLLYPKERNEEKLNRMVDSLLILRYDKVTLVITEKKEAFISDFLHQNNDKEMAKGGNLLGIINAALGNMIDDARKIRDDIISLENSLNKNGPGRTIFNDLLQLKKHLITLTLTYDSDDKLIEFFKREKDPLGIDEHGPNGIIHIEEDLDGLKKLAASYKQYLTSLDTMVNSLSSFRLNAIMKTLTEISIVLTVPTMIYGLWGINLKLPFEDYSFGYLIVIGISFIISLGVWYWIRAMRRL